MAQDANKIQELQELGYRFNDEQKAFLNKLSSQKKENPYLSRLEFCFSTPQITRHDFKQALLEIALGHKQTNLYFENVHSVEEQKNVVQFLIANKLTKVDDWKNDYIQNKKPRTTIVISTGEWKTPTDDEAWIEYLRSLVYKFKQIETAYYAAKLECKAMGINIPHAILTEPFSRLFSNAELAKYILICEQSFPADLNSGELANPQLTYAPERKLTSNINVQFAACEMLFPETKAFFNASKAQSDDFKVLAHYQTHMWKEIEDLRKSGVYDSDFQKIEIINCVRRYLMLTGLVRGVSEQENFFFEIFEVMKQHRTLLLCVGVGVLPDVEQSRIVDKQSLQLKECRKLSQLNLSVLKHLAAHNGSYCEIEELQSKFWPASAPGETENIRQSISKIRSALVKDGFEKTLNMKKGGNKALGYGVFFDEMQIDNIRMTLDCEMSVNSL